MATCSLQALFAFTVSCFLLYEMKQSLSLEFLPLRPPSVRPFRLIRDSSLLFLSWSSRLWRLFLSLIRHCPHEVLSPCPDRTPLFLSLLRVGFCVSHHESHPQNFSRVSGSLSRACGRGEREVPEAVLVSWKELLLCVDGPYSPTWAHGAHAQVSWGHSCGPAVYNQRSVRPPPPGNKTSPLPHVSLSL